MENPAPNVAMSEAAADEGDNGDEVDIDDELAGEEHEGARCDDDEVLVVKIDVVSNFLN